MKTFTFAFATAVALAAITSTPAAAAASGAVTAELAPTTAGCLGVFEQTLPRLHSNDMHNLCELTKDKVVLVVNTASQCGYTGQFEDLEAIYKRYADAGLVILGFPSDSFRQEHDNEAETATVCYVNFGVTFPMMKTSAVTGAEANPVFKALTAAADAAPRWNFHKYLIARDGSKVLNFASSVNPADMRITSAIEALLAEK